MNIIIELLIGFFVGSLGMWTIYMMMLPKTLHMMQLEGYNNKDYIRWIVKNPKKAFKSGVKQLVALALCYGVILLANLIAIRQNAFSIRLFLFEFLIFVAAFYCININQYIKDKRERKNAKKKLVYTARAKRLMFYNFVTFVLLQAGFLYSEEINTAYYIINMYFYNFAVLAFLIATIPVNMIIANWIAWPTEQWVKERYVNSARRKLNKKEYKNLIKIGITGSYGKTSTKFILETILKEKYNVFATPESYNTTMGNVRAIREKLSPEHEVFISEMGARYKNDIKEICDFVNPQFAIITSIGPQHLETFKNIDNIVKTKAELINSLDTSGVVFLPMDNEHCLKLYNKETRKKFCYSLSNKKADVYAKNISFDKNGSSFVAVTKLGDIKCNTRLLGEHNILNILGCITIAIELGLDKFQIENGVSNIEPVPHRLQLIDNKNGTIVIDDAFNSNPVGAKMALDVLSKFDGRRIIITPGMVELGTEEKNENKKFGIHMAKCVDIAILVGPKRSEPIVEGLRENGFDDANIYIVKDLKGATEKLAEISRMGDVVLFENDLPDNYNE